MHNSIEAFIIEEVVIMSEKELLYVEDALGHAQFLQTLANTAATQLSDNTLKEKAGEVECKVKEIFEGFMRLV